MKKLLLLAILSAFTATSFAQRVDSLTAVKNNNGSAPTYSPLDNIGCFPSYKSKTAENKYAEGRAFLICPGIGIAPLKRKINQPNHYILLTDSVLAQVKVAHEGYGGFDCGDSDDTAHIVHLSQIPAKVLIADFIGNTTELQVQNGEWIPDSSDPTCEVFHYKKPLDFPLEMHYTGKLKPTRLFPKGKPEKEWRIPVPKTEQLASK
jgi:hypothetical protein